MNLKLIAGLLTAVVAGGAAVAVAAPGAPEPAEPPEYAHVDVRLGGSAKAISGKKPTLVYLQNDDAGTINPADPSAGGIGPYVDIALSGQTRRQCPRVIDGGVVPSRKDVYQQGTYFNGKGEYHVLLGPNLETQTEPTPYKIKSSLICLKGVK